MISLLVSWVLQSRSQAKYDQRGMWANQAAKGWEWGTFRFRSRGRRKVTARHSLKAGLDSGLWTLDSGRWTLDAGLWTLDSGLWTLDSGLWTLDSGLWTLAFLKNGKKCPISNISFASSNFSFRSQCLYNGFSFWTYIYIVVFKGEGFIKESILDIKTHYKPTETFQYIHFTSCHPPGVKRGFIKFEAISRTAWKISLKNALQTLNDAFKHEGIQRNL